MSLPDLNRPVDPGPLGFDLNAALAAKVEGSLDFALAISAGIDHLLEDFFALQETLVLLVPDAEFNRVFQAARLTELRMLLASIAGRIEVVTDSPGLQMSPQEARELRERIAAGDTPYASDPSASPREGGDAIVELRRKVTRVRESVDHGAQTGNGNHHPGDHQPIGDPGESQ